MRIVLGRRTLVGPGGTQTYAATVAYQLERLGHDVTLATEVAGPFAELVRERGVHVAHPDELPRDVDVIIGHDVVMTATLAERYPDARVVFVSHSDSYDLQLPPLVPGVVDAVVACSERMASRVRASVLDAPIVRLREPIDSDAYFATAPLPPTPRRALILSNYLQGARRDRLVTAWEGAGIECVHVGTPGELLLDPRPEIFSADIVVAKARAALEGMCCGRAVYVYDQFGGDGWITPDNYAAFEADHFAGQATDTPVTLERLTADLADYSPDMGVVNHELVRTHHAARRHAIDLVEVLRGPHPGPADRVETLAELARLARATMRAELHAAEQDARAAVAERELASAERELVAWRDRATEAERQADAARRLLTTKRVRAGIAFGKAADRVRGRT